MNCYLQIKHFYWSDFFFFPQASGNITGVMATSKDKDDCSTHDNRFFNNNKKKKKMEREKKHILWEKMTDAFLENIHIVMCN